MPCRISWMCFSSGLVVLNKYLLSYVGFQYPMTLSGLGMAFSAIASFLTCKVSEVHGKRVAHEANVFTQPPNRACLV